MIGYDVATKILETELFPQYTIADLNLWHYICFAQSGEDFTMKGNTHTQTHTHALVSKVFLKNTHSKCYLLQQCFIAVNN